MPPPGLPLLRDSVVRKRHFSTVLGGTDALTADLVPNPAYQWRVKRPPRSRAREGAGDELQIVWKHSGPALLGRPFEGSEGVEMDAVRNGRVQCGRMPSPPFGCRSTTSCSSPR